MAAPNSPNHALTKFSNSLSQGCVVLEIGPDRKTYYIHKALLSQHSNYFRKALQGPWKEAEEGVFTLDDVELSTSK